ncbi:MAG: hypothetical protein ACR2OI_09770 [Acidimicrobiia bacterium]
MILLAVATTLSGNLIDAGPSTIMGKRLIFITVSLALLAAACATEASDGVDSPLDTDSTTTSVSAPDLSRASSTTTSLAAAEEDHSLPDPDAGLWLPVQDSDSGVQNTDQGPTGTTPPTTAAGSDAEPGRNVSPPAPPTTTPPAVGEVPSSLMEAVRAHAAATTGAPADSIDIRRAQAVVWSDGSLGCPSPGQLYTQALVDGYWIVLGIAEHQLDYRASREGYFKLCVGGGLDPFAVDR